MFHPILVVLKDLELIHYLFEADSEEIAPHEQAEIKRRVRREMTEIFHGETARQDR